ncbi:MAG: UDP-2,3-diacylglucosamine diphosphatase [Burkholderiales bacterium]|nr:UDP-2,3-diacylglucosamine diphosphatase [Burkholderiales bacterium]
MPSSPTLFLSDQHLAPARPAALAAFRAFCAGPARHAAAVYMLGDLFDFWVGDDQMREPFVADVIDALRGLADAGVPLFIAHGNRDFLLGDRFARATGARLLAEFTVLDLHGVATLVCHGDALCTDDVEYQAYRARVRNPVMQRRMLRLPYFLRRRIARWLQGKSAAHKANVSAQIMDVTPAAVAAAFRTHGVRRLIHGHTHRPARHTHAIDGRDCERIVLADWYDRGSYLEVGPDGVHDRRVEVP